MLTYSDALEDLLGPSASDPAGKVATPLPETIGEAELADLLGVSAERIRALSAQGRLLRVAPRTYNLRAAVQANVQPLREHATRAGGKPLPAGDPLKAAKVRQANEAADLLAMKNAAARGELLPATEVERTWTAMLRDVRAAMLALPSRVGQRLGHLSAHDLSELDLEVRQALAEAAGGFDAR